MTAPLSSQNIAAYCRASAQPVQIQVVQETGSTNADLLNQVENLSGPSLLIAENQTAGRGRAGRVWHSAAGATLTFSLAWKLNLPVQALSGLSLAVGVALAQALADFDVTVQLKWPNDLLLDGKKLGGTLIETAVAPSGAATGVWAVIGVGLNITMPDALASQIDRPATDAPALAGLDRNKLMAALLSNLSEALLVFEEQGFKAFMKRWNALHAYADQPVVIQDRDRILHQGTAIGADATGCLLLNTSAGQVAVMAGDVSLHKG